VWSQDEPGRVHTPFEPVVLVATLSLIPVLIIEADTKAAWVANRSISQTTYDYEEALQTR
jgi:hypothetical protein